jgi:hypothetical protein
MNTVRLCFAQTFTKKQTGIREKMRQCKCGGQVRQSELTSGRVAWTCTSCKRYEIKSKDFVDTARSEVMNRPKSEPPACRCSLSGGAGEDDV